MDVPANPVQSMQILRRLTLVTFALCNKSKRATESGGGLLNCLFTGGGGSCYHNDVGGKVNVDESAKVAPTK